MQRSNMTESVFAKQLHSVYRWLTKSDRMNGSNEPKSTATAICTPTDLAAIAIHAWKIGKRAERDGNIPRPVGRNAEQILSILERAGVEVISYASRKVDAGAKVQILEAVNGEEDLVIEEHEPEVQVSGVLVHEAVVSIGKGQ